MPTDQSSRPLQSIFMTRRGIIVSLLLIAITWAIYARVARFELVSYDDAVYVNAHVKRGLTFDGLRWAFVGYHDSNWIPCVWLSLMVDSTLFGSSPAGYHVTNVVIHTANVLLIFWILTSATHCLEQSAFVAALFAIHPLHVESVAWVSERKDVLSMFFGLLALAAYVAYARQRRIGYLAAAFLAYVGSLLSKQTFVTLPFLLLLLDYWPLGRLNPAPAASPKSGRDQAASGGDAATKLRFDSRLIVEKLPFFAVSAVFCVIAVLAQASTGAFDSVSLKTRCLNAVFVYFRYLEKTLVPINLSAFYPHPRAGLSLMAVSLAFVALAAVTAFAAVNWRRRPYLIVGWLWYLGTMVPMIGLVQVGGQQMADRYTYLPLLGVYIMAAWLVPSLVPARLASPRLGITLAAACVLGYAAVAWFQVDYWRNSVALYQRMLAATDDNYVGHYLLGIELLKQRKFDEGLSHTREAVRIEPHSGRAHYLLGVALQTAQQHDEAAREYQTSLTLNERYFLPHLNLGTIFLSRRQNADAKREFERAAQLEPDDGRAVANLAALALQTGDDPQAIAYAQRALQIDGSLSMCHRMLAVALQKQGRLDEAISEARQLVAAFPKDRQAQALLDQVLASQNGGRLSKP
jgi:Flp pilus assembly protein TadD